MASAVTSLSPCSLCNVRPQFRQCSSTGITSRLVQCGIRRTGSIVCSGETERSTGHSEPPKLEPFSQGLITRAMRERSFLQKTEDAMTERCLTLDGEAAYQCWEAVSEYENIKEDAEKECTLAEPGTKQDACKPLERLEHMVRQSGGVNSLIDNVLMVAKIKEVKKKKAPPSEDEWLKAVAGSGEEDVSPSDRLEFLEDGGIPKSEKEMLEEKKMLDEIKSTMPDSLLTKVLKRRGHRSNEQD